MLAEVFYWVVNMSILAGFTGLIVALLRKIPKIHASRSISSGSCR
jgi:hypothetical protein